MQEFKWTKIVNNGDKNTKVSIKGRSVRDNTERCTAKRGSSNTKADGVRNETKILNGLCPFRILNSILRYQSSIRSLNCR